MTRTDNQKHGERTCNDCGSTVSGDANFCGSCGADVRPVCEACGSRNRATNQFCEDCGHPLQGDEVSSDERPNISPGIPTKTGDGSGRLASVEQMAEFQHLTLSTSRSYSRALGDACAEFGVSYGQIPVLVYLWEDDGAVQNEIAANVGIEAPTLVRTLDRMGRDNLATRGRSATDRRHMEIRLTERGRQIESGVLEALANLHRKLIRGIKGEQIESAISILKVLIERLEGAYSN